MNSNYAAFTFDDVLLIPNYNHYESRRLVDTSVKDRTEKLELELPLISSNMDSITEHKMANFMRSQGAMGALHRFLTIERNIEEFKKCEGPVFVSVGCSDKELERAEALKDAGATHYIVDVAHAHARYVGKTLKELRALLGDLCIMAGNVATYAGADYLASCGADIIKVGIGGGSVCTTRIKTGFGVPTLSSILECKKIDRSIVADGGVRSAGDVVKALAFGADFVMLGGMLAGTRPTPLPVQENAQGKKVKIYRGMASREAQEGFVGALADWKTAEGVSTEVVYSESEEGIVGDIRGGLRSGLTYGGAANIRELQRKLGYQIITPAGRLESLPHKAF